MSNPIDNLQEVEALFIENKLDNNIIAELITRSQGYQHQPEHTQHSSLILSLISSLTKQQLENSNFITDRWKNHIYCTETKGRTKINIVRTALHYLLSIDTNKVEIAKIFNVSRWTVGRWIKDHDLSNALIDPEEDSVIENHLRQVIVAYPNLGELHARGILLAKGMKIKRNRLRIILRRIKPSNSLSMSTIRRRLYRTRTANSMWHLDSTHKLKHWRFVTSGCADGHSRKIVWLKCSNNNLADAACNYFLDAIQKHQCPFQVRGDKGAENRMIAKHVIAIRGEDIRGYTGGRSCHNTRIERFWGECNRNVMGKYAAEFTYLEQLDLLDRHDENDSWVLHEVYLPIINQKLVEMEDYCNNHPITSANGQTPNQMHAISALRDQVISTSVSAGTIDILHNWQNVFSPDSSDNITVPTLQSIVLNDQQMNFVNTISNNTETSPRSKCIDTRAYLRELMQCVFLKFRLINECSNKCYFCYISKHFSNQFVENFI